MNNIGKRIQGLYPQNSTIYIKQMPSLLIILVILVVVTGLFSAVYVSRRRHHRDLREFLEPPLNRCGLTYLSSIYPGAFNVGPFPKIEVRIGRPQSNIGGIRGEYNEYRIVNFNDAKGTTYRIWALVEFELF